MNENEYRFPDGRTVDEVYATMPLWFKVLGTLMWLGFRLSHWRKSRRY